ncbi:hypothetical protein D3C81_2294260 [compost metagenome]
MPWNRDGGVATPANFQDIAILNQPICSLISGFLRAIHRQIRILRNDFRNAADVVVVVMGQ